MKIIKLLQKHSLFLAFFINCAYAQNQEENLSIRLKQAPLVQTLQQLAADKNINLVIDDQLQETISLELENIDLPQLFEAITKIQPLNVEHKNGIYYVTSKNFKLANIEDINASNQLKTITIKLKFARAADVVKSLTTGKGSLLSTEGSIGFDERSNLLIVKEQPTSLKNIQRLVEDLDKPIEQIAIEARIVTMSDEGLQELGVRWGLFNPTVGSHSIAGSLAGNGLNNIVDNLNVNFGALNTPAGSVALQVAKISGRLLDLELTALERENNVKIIASPKLLTTNKKSASIKQGTEIPYISVNQKSGAQSVEFREAVLGLEVTPHISKDNSILLDLLVTQNSPGPILRSSQSEVVTIDKQEINTQVFAKDGETIVLGGIFQDSISKGIDKVPLLGDIPIIKTLFSKEIKKHNKRELIIFVTPHIVKEGEANQTY